MEEKPQEKLEETEEKVAEKKVEGKEAKGFLADLVEKIKNYAKKNPIVFVEHLLIILLGVNWARKVTRFFGPQTTRGLLELGGELAAGEIGDRVVKYARIHKALVSIFGLISVICLVSGAFFLKIGLIALGLIIPIVYWALVLVAVSFLIVITRGQDAFKKKEITPVGEDKKAVYRSPIGSIWHSGLIPVMATLIYIMLIARLDTLLISHKELLIFTVTYMALFIGYYKFMKKFVIGAGITNLIVTTMVVVILLLPQPWLSRVKAVMNERFAGEISAETATYLSQALKDPSLLPKGDKQRGDVNGDGKFDGKDTLYIQNYVKGIGPAPVNWPPVPKKKEEAKVVKEEKLVKEEQTTTEAKPPEQASRVDTLIVPANSFFPAKIKTDSGDIGITVNDQDLSKGRPSGALSDNSGKYTVFVYHNPDGTIRIEAKGKIVWINWRDYEKDCDANGTPLEDIPLKFLNDPNFDFNKEYLVVPDANFGALVGKNLKTGETFLIGKSKVIG